jgi:nucleoside-diphosphate-sugar epimerase
MAASVIAITGASGYIGRHFVAELVRLGGYEIRVLTRGNSSSDQMKTFGPNVKIFTGDLMQPGSLVPFIPTGGTVINLAYMWNAGEVKNLQATQVLIAQCAKAGISRLIHCSTAAVAGRVTQNVVSEELECRPVTEYGKTKLKIEQAIVAGANDRFDSVILRPTAVFGIDGEPIKKLAADLVTGSRLKNYAKSCLFGKRQMNLVHISTVVAAIVFMIRHPARLNGEVFIVSDDDEPDNNYSSVESLLSSVFGRPGYPLPKVPIPLFVLRTLLTLLGRNNVNPLTRYSPDKLLSLGFERPIDFWRGLTDYANWYRSTFIDRDGDAPV